MADIGSILKQEIARLARREIRSAISPLHSLLSSQRKHLAALKRELASAQARVTALEKAAKSQPRAVAAVDRPLRFVAKGLRSLRTRLGVSGPNFATLLGVSSQTVYNWEQGKSTPRPAQLATLAALRSAGKRDVAARLTALQTSAEAAGT